MKKSYNRHPRVPETAKRACVFIFCLLLAVPLYGNRVQEIVSAEILVSENPIERHLLYYAPSEVEGMNREALDRIISIQLSDVSIEEALQHIAERGGLRISYSTDVKDNVWSRRVSLDWEEATVLGALYSVLADTDLRLKITHRGLLIVHKDDREAVGENLASTVEMLQELVTGQVTDSESGEPLPGVNIVVEGTTIGTVTDLNGEFDLMIPSLSESLVVSFVGYQNQVIPLQGRSDLDIALDLEIFEAGEVVVGAYAPQRERDVTGSISSINLEDATRMPLATQRVDQMLQGRAPGVNVRTASGAPGGEVIVRIRGIESIQGGNEALIVVDGLQGADLRSLNPRDIQSVEILKDASATAMFGSEGASGVVLITTRKGQRGKPIIDYSYEMGVQNLINNVNLMTAAEYARNQNLLEMADNLDRTPQPLFSESEIGALEQGEGVTDWIDEIFDPALTQNHQMSVSGATEDINYRVSGSFLNQDGILINSGYGRFSLRANINAEITEWSRFSLNWSGTREDDGSPLFGSATGYVNNPITNAFTFPPTMSVYDENGNYIERAPSWLRAAPKTGWNPVASAIEQDINNTSTRNNFNAMVDFRLMEGLNLQLTGGAIVSDHNVQQFFNNNTEIGRRLNGQATARSSESRRYQTSNILTYQTDLDLHSITATAVAEQKWNDNFYTNISNSSFQNHETGFYDLGGSDIQQTSSGESNRIIRSAMGHVAYKFDDRYLLSASLRTDGSSVFGSENKWATFPSMSVGWRLSEEPYLGFANQGFFDNLLLRASWGMTGNQAISPYGSLARIAQTGNYPYDGTGLQTGFRINSAANPSLKWETTEQTNVGLDMEILGGRFSFAADYYVKTTEDLLMNRQIPTHTGLGNILDNVGSVENKGFEFQLGAQGQSSSLSWSSNFNFTLNRNKVLDLGETEILYWSATGGGHQVNPDDPFIRMREGEPFGQMYGYKVLGTWNTDEADQAAVYMQLPGDLKYDDVNGDGVIDVNDEQLIGNALPDYFFGFNSSVGYRNFEFNFLIEGQVGHDIFNIAKVKRLHDDQTAKELVNRWTEDNQDTIIRAVIDAQTRADTGMQQQNINFPSSASSMTSKFVEDASYLRLKSLGLGYNLPVTMTQQLGLRNMRIYVTGTNLVTLTDYTGWDPEVSSFTGNDAQFGTDFSSYPNSRVLTLGVNVSF